MNSTNRKTGMYYGTFRLNNDEPKILCFVTLHLVSISEKRGIIEKATLNPQNNKYPIDTKLKKAAIANLVGKVRNYASLQNVKDI